MAHGRRIRGPRNREAGEIRVWTLRALDRCNDQPLPDGTLRDMIALAFPHVADVPAVAEAAIESMAADGWMASITRPIDGCMLWVLTDRGRGVVASLGR